MFNILLIEDNETFRRLVKNALQDHFPGVGISEAANAAQATRKIEAAPPDLLFVDIKLPGQNGLELAKTVRSARPSIVIVFLTSHDLPEYREAASNLGVERFLSKGAATLDQVVKLVESLLSERRPGVAGRNQT